MQDAVLVTFQEYQSVTCITDLEVVNVVISEKNSQCVEL